MSRRKDGSVPPTAVGWMRGLTPSTGTICGPALSNMAARSRMQAMHHWIRKGDGKKAGDMARALHRDAMRELALCSERERP